MESAAGSNLKACAKTYLGKPPLVALRKKYVTILLSDGSTETKEAQLQDATNAFVKQCNATNPVNVNQSYASLCYYKKDCGRKGNQAGSPYYGRCDIHYASEMLTELRDKLKSDKTCTLCGKFDADVTAECLKLPPNQMYHPLGYTWKEIDPADCEMNVPNGYRSYDCCSAWRKDDVGCTRDPQYPAKYHQVCFYAPDYKQLVLEGL